MTLPTSFPRFFVRYPLAPIAALFLFGAVLGRWLPGAGWPLAAAGGGAWALWLLAEWGGHSKVASIALAAAIVASGSAVWVFSHSQIEPDHIARFLPAKGESLATLRCTVEVAPEADSAHGGSRFMARATAIWTNAGWAPSTGDVLVNWNGTSRSILRGDAVEIEGWLSRPPAAANPGGYDARQVLAADRVFALLRVPHTGGVRLLDSSAAQGAGSLARLRLFLRAKLLEHVVRENVPAAYTLTALFLGYRDPSIRDVSQAFSDAGVAHLLAISGSHVIFFAGLVWGLLRFLPLRPRLRELLIVAATAAYVLATPCGPPVVRAFLALAGVLLARLLGRPGNYLNILCAAAIAAVLLRPMDLQDAGFQLSFVSAAALILLAPRVHAALFGAWLARETLAAELARRPWIFRRLRAFRLVAVLVTANLVGSLAAAPLVAYHFGQVNPWAIVTGILALPVVSLAMIAAAVQLVAGFVGLAGLLAPLAAAAGSLLIAWVECLARVPGAALPLRQPPAWLIVAAYAMLLLWIVRRRLGVSRAAVCNGFLLLAVTVVTWLTFTAPMGAAKFLALDAGDGSCILLRTPAGKLWLINAGHGQSAGGSVLDDALVPAMRIAGSRRLDGLILTAMDGPHGADAGDVISHYRPRQVWLPAGVWDVRGETFAGATLSAALGDTQPRALSRGLTLDLGDGCTLKVLWPQQQRRQPRGGDAPDLIFICNFAGRRVLVADPRQAALLPGLAGDGPLDAAIFTGPPRDDPILRSIVAAIPEERVIWCGRGRAMNSRRAPGGRDTNNGAASLEVTSRGIVIKAQPLDE